MRRVCPECREAYEPSDEDLTSIGINPADFGTGKARRVKFKGVEKFPPPGRLYRAHEGGCPACLGAGYKGRTAIYELLFLLGATRRFSRERRYWGKLQGQIHRTPANKRMAKVIADVLQGVLS